MFKWVLHLVFGPDWAFYALIALGVAALGALRYLFPRATGLHLAVLSAVVIFASHGWSYREGAESVRRVQVENQKRFETHATETAKKVEIQAEKDGKVVARIRSRTEEIANETQNRDSIVLDRSDVDKLRGLFGEAP